MLHWKQLIGLTDAELAKLDIAQVNLSCAEGLPGFEHVDVAACIEKLDRWAGFVRHYTQLSYDQFFVPAPSEFNNSEAYFRALSLVTALQRHCKVRYNPAKKGIPDDAPFDFEDEFIHGAILGPGGTCATLPVVYIAVGRRLGYPLRLVHTPRHAFLRWDDPVTGERLNVEATGEGLGCFSDEHYRAWPRPFDAEAERAFGYLRSLTPRQELASFLCKRGHRLRDHRRFREALQAFMHASILDGDSAAYPSCIVSAVHDWDACLKRCFPPSFPVVEVLLARNRRRFPSVPWEVERSISILEAVEDCLKDRFLEHQWWDPLRNNRSPLSKVPASITVDRTKEQFNDF